MLYNMHVSGFVCALYCVHVYLPMSTSVCTDVFVLSCMCLLVHVTCVNWLMVLMCGCI